MLFERIPLIDDVQVGWLLLIFCAATRANYWFRTVPPEYTSEYAEQHDQSVLRCLSSILQMDGLPPHTHEAASMPWITKTFTETRPPASRQHEPLRSLVRIPGDPTPQLEHTLRGGGQSRREDGHTGKSAQKEGGEARGNEAIGDTLCNKSRTLLTWCLPEIAAALWMVPKVLATPGS